jgi:choline dehydrogenase-like flavoprotein
MAQVIRSPKVYDVCIIGSGAAGGTAAKVLTESGLGVVMLEAGPPLDPDKDFKEHVWPYELEHRGAGVGAQLRNAINDEFMAPNGAWSINGEPYVSARALLGEGRTIGGGSPYALHQSISERAPMMAWAMTGR